MKIDIKKCPKCNSELLLLDVTNSHREWYKDIISIFGFSVSIIGFDILMILVFATLGFFFGILWYIFGVIVVMHILQKETSEPIDAVLTYKCNKCSSYHCFEESVKMK